MIYAYTGTGNSLWAAREVAAAAGEDEVRLLPRDGGAPRPVDGDPGTLGLVFPVHMWGVPRAVVALVAGLTLPPSTYCFAVATNAGQTAATLPTLARILAARGLRLSLGIGAVLPSNYVPWGGPGPQEHREALYAAARAKLAAFGARVRRREEGPVERGPLWERAVFTPLHRWAAPYVPGMDGKFWVDDRCNGCGVCARVCGAANVELLDGKPRWLGRCEQCLACLQWCPREALQWGKRTPRFERYHHPEVSLGDVVGEGVGGAKP